MTGRTVVVTAGFMLAGLLAPVAAPAFYGDGATIVSADLQRLEQGDDASGSPAMSGDGRYVAFQTRARNFFADDDPDPAGKYRVGGVFRRDLRSGALERVADGDTFNESDNAIVFRGARAPSSSADGRYVVFTTAQKLVAADTNVKLDVYVRDMTRVPGAPGAYTLASAKDGGDVPASYGAFSGDANQVGSDAWPGAAISANGRKVAFRTVEVSSDLPNRGGLTTPGFNLFVRDLDAKMTTLVTRDRSTGDPMGGAVGGPAGISGDGTTVAWSGQNAPAQTRFLTGESQDPFATFYLWRRVADGPAAPTRRITGEADLDDPGCPPNASIQPDGTLRGPCYGPLTTREEGVGGISNRLPSLSADGYTVGFLTAAGPRPNIQTGTGLDAWVTDMSPGVSRKSGSRELTREGQDATANGQVESATLSPDGRRLALTTTRSKFVLGAPRPIGTFRAFADVRDLYLIDLPANTIERASRAYTGGDDSGDASSPTLSGDGSSIAFASTAGDLFFGDANERSDVFAVFRGPEPPGGGLPDAPPPSATEDDPGAQVDLGTDAAAPFLRVSPRRQKDGRVVLVVNVPAAGALDAVARARVPVGVVRKGRRRRTKEQQVARSRLRAKAAGRVSIVLVAARRYRSLVKRKRGLSATVKLQFKPARGPTLNESVRIVFAVGGKAARAPR